MKTMQRYFLILFSIFSMSFGAFAQAPEPDVLIRAAEDEMARTVTQLQLRDYGKPYFVEYGIEDEEVFSVQAKFGAITASGINRARNASVQIRLGNYDFDNTNLYTTGTLASSVNLALDDDYDSIRHDLWLISDAVYKSSIEQMSSKKAFLQNNTVEEKLPDLSHEKLVVSIEVRRKLEIDQAKWEAFIRSLSAIFRKYPEITDSSVSFYARLENRYLINNEGTKIRVPTFLISLNVYAEATTPEGLKLTPSCHIYARSFDKLPSETQITKTVEKMADDLTKLRNAPAFAETYIGPVLFTDRAAVQLFSQLLAPNLDVARPPLGSNSDAETGPFAERVNRRVLPASISITDDPTLTEINGYDLIGSYTLDRQGVEAKPLTIIENGILKNQLASRVPTKRYPTSNGRARSGYGTPYISNLVVEAKGGKSFAELKQELLNSCKAQDLAYGILLREIDSTFGASGNSLTPPIMAYKVYVADGREELIRNLSIDSFPLRELRQLLGVGSDRFSLNHLNGNGHQGDGIPYSVTAPSILMDELVLRKDTSSKAKPLIMTHPYFNKGN